MPRLRRMETTNTTLSAPAAAAPAHGPRLAGDLAIWFFILAELLAFGVFFAAYAFTRANNIELFNAETPLVMLWQPNHDAVMAKSVDGYTYQFYRQADFRDLKRV